MSKKQKIKKKRSYREDLLRKKGIHLASTRKKRSVKVRKTIDVTSLREKNTDKDNNPFIHMSN